MNTQPDATSIPISLEKSRLLSLIEFSKQSSRLRGKPATNVSAHGLFALYEHEIQGLPGVRVNINGPESDDEIWLAVARLHETKPPEIGSALLQPWVQKTQTPTEEPLLREVIEGARLIEAGTYCSLETPPTEDKPSIDPEERIALTDFEYADMVQTQFAYWLDTKWRPWAEGEKPRRRSIRLYSQLLTLKQQLEGSIVEAQIELVWGVGLGIWNTQGAHLSYPLVGQLVELALNPVTAEMEISPRDVDAHLEVDWYASVNNPGLAELEKTAKDFFAQAATTFLPFDRSTFGALLQSAATTLDANGIYWPTAVPLEDRTLPKADDKLKVTDSWLLFARPRTNNLFLQDLEKLKNRIEEADDYPPAIAVLVTDPDTTNTAIELPVFRGISAASYASSSTNSQKPKDLYFPKPFNGEQVRIVQLLEIHDGVIVQGPPGTGKTHTIANVICHFLAEGKRVLVTSDLVYPA
ncbi:MAG: hypothetical protein WCQ50_13105 [Spirochaetota bacterium]